MARWAWLLAAVLISTQLAGCSDTIIASDEAEPRTQPGPATSGPPSNDRPAHVHDLWGPETVRTLMDGYVPLTTAHNHQFDEPPRAQHTHGCTGELVSDSQGGSVRFTLPPGEIVPPGTARLDLRVDWSDPTITGVRLLYKAPGHDDGEHGGHSHAGDYSDAGVFAPGDNVSLELTPEMTDAGHAVQSHWAFFLCAAGDEALSLAEGSAHIEIMAHRAETLPLDPPHPEFWGTNATLTVGSFTWSGQSVAAGNQHSEAWLHIPLHGIIPWGTRTVAVTAWANGTGLPQDATFTLYYKDCREPGWVFATAEAQPRDGAMVFTVDIDDPDMLDGPYATRSDWHLWIRMSSPTLAATPLGMGTWSAPQAYEGAVEGQVVALAG